jgi:integrase
MTKIIIRKNIKFLNQEQFFKLLNDFIKESSSGKRLKKNGSRISSTTVETYGYFKRVISLFSEETSFEIKLFIVDNSTQREKDIAANYWRKFYNEFTTFMYNKMGYYDNYVGNIIKTLRAFFNYLIESKHINIGNFHKTFYAPKEEIDIITLNHYQLNYIIYNQDFDLKVKQNELEKIKDIFIFGCTVALRISDLLALTSKNLVIQNEKYYLNVRSQKTQTKTSIKLPDYAVEIIKKYKNQQRTLLPKFSLGYLDLQLKLLAKLIPDDFELIKTRLRRGKQVVIYKDAIKKIHYKLSDHISTHTMRRTGITTMLNLGMPEHLVRKISGHAANSREFFRYVELSQSFIDDETDRIFNKINQLNVT